MNFQDSACLQRIITNTSLPSILKTNSLLHCWWSKAHRHFTLTSKSPFSSQKNSPLLKNQTTRLSRFREHCQSLLPDFLQANDLPHSPQFQATFIRPFPFFKHYHSHLLLKIPASKKPTPVQAFQKSFLIKNKQIPPSQEASGKKRLPPLQNLFRQ